MESEKTSQKGHHKIFSHNDKKEKNRAINLDETYAVTDQDGNIVYYHGQFQTFRTYHAANSQRRLLSDIFLSELNVKKINPHFRDFVLRRVDDLTAKADKSPKIHDKSDKKPLSESM